MSRRRSSNETMAKPEEEQIPAKEEQPKDCGEHTERSIRRGRPYLQSCSSTPLHLAAFSGDEDEVRRLLESGVAADILDDRGHSALHVASGRAVMELLLSKEPKLLHGRTCRGDTPLHCAARRGSAGDVAALLSLGANMDDCNVAGQTPLASAAWARSLDSARVLLDSGADPDRRTREEYGPLHVAALQGHVAMVMLLLTGGADPSLTTGHFVDGRWLRGKPADLAAHQGKIWVVKLLRGNKCILLFRHKFVR